MTFGRHIQIQHRVCSLCFSFRLSLFFINVSSFKLATNNNANFENYASHCMPVNMLHQIAHVGVTDGPTDGRHGRTDDMQSHNRALCSIAR